MFLVPTTTEKIHAERIADRTLSLPLSAGIADEAVEHVIDAMRSLLA